MARKKKASVKKNDESIREFRPPTVTELYNEASVRQKIIAKDDSVGVDVLFNRSVVRVVANKDGSVKSIVL